MAHTAQPPTKHFASLSVSDLQSALPKLQRRIDEINAIDPLQATGTYTPEFSAIRDNANATLMEIFGPNIIEYDRYKVVSIYTGVGNPSKRELVTGFQEGKKRALIKIDNAIKFINEKLHDLQTITVVDTEEWLRAADALALLGMSHDFAARTICKRAHAGLIKARAARFIRDGQRADNVDIPDEFWWAEGGQALHQNWATGDFDTWINQRIHLEAFGVTFLRSDIERLRHEKTPQQERQKSVTTAQKVFIGHGHSLVWRELKDLLEDRLHVSTDEFNSVAVAGIATVNRLEEMLDNAAFAFLILTAEDEQKDGKLHARLNVVHEAGLFQGKLSFRKAIILREETCEEFSNIHGLGQIPFPTGNIRAASEEIRRVLEREGLIASR